jgi:hypothetical protein
LQAYSNRENEDIQAAEIFGPRKLTLMNNIIVDETSFSDKNKSDSQVNIFESEIEQEKIIQVENRPDSYGT